MAEATAKAGYDSRFWLVVAAACAGAFEVAYNTTAVMTALPAIKSSLDLSVDTLQWVVNIYMLASAVSLAAMGHFADTFGMMRIFGLGLCLFAIGSITIAFSGDAAVLLAGRAFQGSGVAALMATSVALIAVTAPPDKRASAHGLWAAAVALGFALGPLIGGSLTDAVSWRAIFALDIAIAIAVALLCVRVVHLGLVPRALVAEKRIDFLGIGLLFVALASFLYGLTSGQLFGWTSLQALALFAAAVIGAAAFIVRERRAAEPLIQFGFLRHLNYTAATIGMFLHGVTQMGVLYFTNLFLQAPEGLNFSAAQAGLALLPFTGAMFAISLVLPRLIGPGSFRIPVTAGMLMLVLGFWLMHSIDHQTPYSGIWWMLTILGIGVGFNWALLPRVGLSALPDAHAGQGSGVLNTTMFSGLATGTAVGGAIASHIKRTLIDPVVETVATHASDLDSLQVTLVHGSTNDIAHALAKLSPDEAAKLKDVMAVAFDSGFSGVMLMMAIVGALGAVICFALIRPPAADLAPT